jgi:hypothetical protein
MITLELTKCVKCGHDIEDHIVEDDFSCCVGECCNSVPMPTDEVHVNCPCKRYVAKERPVQ